VCNTSAGDRRHLIMILPARFAATSYLRQFLPLEKRRHGTLGYRSPGEFEEARKIVLSRCCPLLGAGAG
jgi:hypothetical protein